LKNIKKNYVDKQVIIITYRGTRFFWVQNSICKIYCTLVSQVYFSVSINIHLHLFK